MGRASKRKQERKKTENVVIAQAGVASAQGTTCTAPEPEEEN